MRAALFVAAAIFAPFVFGWLVYLFVFWGAAPWPGDWQQDARSIIAFAFCCWCVLVAMMAADS